MAKPLRRQQVLPFHRRGNLVRRDVARVVDDAVAGERLAQVHAAGIVDGVVADLVGHVLVRHVGRLGQQLVAAQHLEGVGRAGPEHFGSLARRRLAHEGNAGHRVLVQDLQRDAGVGLFKRGLVSLGQVLGERRDHRDGAGQGGRRADGQQRPCKGCAHCVHGLSPWF
ncbi:hypothetical protein D3C72_1690640 [compost metagenome]